MVDRKLKINLIKIDKDENEIVQNDNKLIEMIGKVRGFCQALFSEAQEFDEEQVFADLVEYIAEYHRILYSPISNTIYQYYQEHESDDAAKKVGSMLSNVEAVIAYTKTDRFAKKKEESKRPENYEDASKAILKIWDHISLAQQQYSMLKKSDKEYKKQIDDRLIPFKEDLTKDMNSQLLTMIGIFTALAFLIFGGISSLENVFSNPQLPLFKLMIVGCVWGLCILNLVFVFLFCVGKMANLNFKSNQDENATIFQKYPIVWWSNLIIVAIMVFSIWGYYLTKKNIHNWFDKICLNNSVLSSIIGTVIIIVVFFVATILLVKVTKTTKEKE